MESMIGDLRIGELSRRVGVSPDVLRAWERRYAVVRPQRSKGGLRLYSDADVSRVRTMQAHMRAGLSAAEAARAALAGDQPAVAPRRSDAPASELAPDAADLAAALGRLDDGLAQATIDRLLVTYTFETVASQVLMPYLVDLGERWQRGEATIAEEHFATHVLRGRLLALIRGRRALGAPRAVLACPPEEMHDIALVIFAVALDRRGWRVTLLGANTPVATVRDAADTLDANAVVIAATVPERLTGVAVELRALAHERRLLLAGPGATAAVAERIAAERLNGGPVLAADALSARRPTSVSRPGDAGDWVLRGPIM